MKEHVQRSDCSTILITGAGKRLGLFLTEHYLESGWRVIAHYNTANEMSEHDQERWLKKGRYVALQADLTSAVDVEVLVANVGALNLTIDAVIHNASYFVADDPFASLQQRWQLQQNMMAVHVMSVEALTMGLISCYAKSASLVAITDIYVDKPNQRFASYCAAKAALQNLCLSYSQRLAPNVRVNIIQPGPIQFLAQHSEAYRQKVLSQSLLKRELGYGAILQAAEYLQRAQGVTGSILKVDGGRANANHYEQSFSVN
jgi:dihydromonapterin reductase/dihydrofolate reductase